MIVFHLILLNVFSLPNPWSLPDTEHRPNAPTSRGHGGDCQPTSWTCLCRPVRTWNGSLWGFGWCSSQHPRQLQPDPIQTQSRLWYGFLWNSHHAWTAALALLVSNSCLQELCVRYSLQYSDIIIIEITSYSWPWPLRRGHNIHYSRTPNVCAKGQSRNNIVLCTK